MINGNTATEADEADVRFTFTLSDVRRKADLSDYTGELQAKTSVRMTDLFSGPRENESATVSDFPFPFTVPCAATPSDSGIGSTCAVSTTADAVVPGSVPEGTRAIWELGQFQVDDGGADGVAATEGDNTPFARQGIFTP